MLNIRKKILTNEKMRPIAVQISYKDWLKIEHQLCLIKPYPKKDLSVYSGKLVLTEDPLEYQHRMREEWE